jgi:predicted methyltransferase
MKLVLSVALLALALPLSVHAQTVPAPIATALTDPGRPQADKDRDAARHPGEILAFAGVAPGQKVADFIMGGGYWTRILAPIVGAKGKVYAYQPAEFIAYRAAYADDQKAAVEGRGNVVPSSDSLKSFAFPEPLDAIITVQNWHDLHLKTAPPGAAGFIAKKLYDSLKPGGVLLVIDHAANPDPAFALPQTLHRIDPAAARAEIEGAGFKFEGELPLLRNPNDPHTANVFTPEIRGKTDQFIYKFRKPAM